MTIVSVTEKSNTVVCTRHFGWIEMDLYLWGEHWTTELWALFTQSYLAVPLLAPQVWDRNTKLWGQLLTSLFHFSISVGCPHTGALSVPFPPRSDAPGWPHLLIHQRLVWTALSVLFHWPLSSSSQAINIECLVERHLDRRWWEKLEGCS